MSIYNEPLFRPPAEADSLICQLTLGCSYNKCRFCAMYKTKKFYIKSESEFESHIINLKKIYPLNIRRCFIADGDAFTCKTEKILNSISIIKKYFQNISQFNLYGSAFSIKNKTIDDLKKLKLNGVRIIYLGIESGDQEILDYMNKNFSINDIIEQCNKIIKSGIKLSVTLITGLSNKNNLSHIIKSAELINIIKPNYTSLLNFMTEYTEFQNNPEYNNFDLKSYLKELKTFIEIVDCKTVFRSNHASNFLHLSGTLPKHKNKLLKEISSLNVL